MGALLPMGTAATAVAPDEKVFVMNSDNRNLLLAVALSMAVLFGWQILVVGPEMEKEAAQQQLLAEQQEEQPAADSGTPQATAAADQPVTGAMPTTTGDKATAIADTAKRIVIDAPLVSGSFSLQGARIDDVVLTDYRETQEAASENIHFLKKISSNNPFFAEFGWAVSDTQQPMPGADTLWTASVMCCHRQNPSL